MKKKTMMKQLLLNLVFILMCVVFVIPLILLISASFSSEKDIIMDGYRLLPKTFDLTAYRYVLKNPTAILNAYQTTIVFSVITMVMATLLMSMIAYPLTKKNLKGRKGMSFFLYFTLLFSGGMVPTYILITQYLNLDDTIWVYILPALISPWHVFMLRSFFTGIPDAINEAALVDGASEYRIFFTMMLPLSKPALATIALFTFLTRWNSWMESMLYINSRDDLLSLQYLLQKIMNDLQMLMEAEQSGLNGSIVDVSEVPGETARMAMAVLAAGPALIVFPFFQKYFTKGLTVGSVKG